MKLTRVIGLLGCLTLLAVISAIGVVSAASIQDRYEMERDHASLLTCKYLEADDSQHNAYRYPKLNMGFCCLCPRGTKFIGDCNTSDPTSTQCQKCNEGEYVDFEPHLQLKCEKKRWRSCFPPKVYVPGTITEADSCKCPAGTSDDGYTCVAVEAPPTAPLQADISTKESDAATDSEQTSVTYEHGVAIAVTDGTELAVWPKIKQMILNRSTATINTTINRVDHSNGTGEELSVGQIAGIFAGVVILLAVVGIGLGIGKPWKRCSPQTREPMEKGDYSPDSSRDTMNMESVVDSSHVLIAVKTNSCNPDSKRPSTISGRNSRVESVPLIGPTEEFSEPCLPANQSPPPSMQMSGSQKQDKFPSTNERENIRRKAGKILTKDHSQFACDVANSLGQKCHRDHILPMFRLICGIDDEVALKDLDRDVKSTREFLYQCMQHALTGIGPENLSPFYLWDKISSMGYRQYTEIVSDDIENYLQNNVSS